MCTNLSNKSEQKKRSGNSQTVSYLIFIKETGPESISVLVLKIFQNRLPTIVTPVDVQYLAYNLF